MKDQMKDQAFKVARGVFRFFFSLPRRVRHLWRTLLAWCRISRIYHHSGMEGLKRSVRGVSKDNLRRKASPKSGSNHTRPPFR